MSKRLRMGSETRAARRKTLRKMQDNQCCWCGKPMQHEKPGKWDYETFEHLTPASLGGKNGLDNLALAHRRCNEKRGIESREPLVRRVAGVSQ